MARADTVSLTYTAEIADLKKKLAEIPGATGKEAKKAVAEVSKAVKLVAKAEAEAKKAAEGSAAGLKSLGDAAGKTNESFASMGAALSTVSPELGGMVSRIGAVANGLKGAANASQLMGGSLATMVGTLGIAGVAAGAAFIAYQTMAREMEQAAGMARLLREVSDSLEPSLRQLEALSWLWPWRPVRRRKSKRRRSQPSARPAMPCWTTPKPSAPNAKSSRPRSRAL
jgi:uncharacterized phage infection (PIP) family protein YhgE